jgi:hypothetical protein
MLNRAQLRRRHALPYSSLSKGFARVQALPVQLLASLNPVGVVLCDLAAASARHALHVDPLVFTAVRPGVHVAKHRSFSVASWALHFSSFFQLTVAAVLTIASSRRP